MTSATKISEYILVKGKNEGKPLTNKRLQKLLYYIQAWHLAYKNKPIFNDKIEAWIHGPAIRSIYEMYKRYVANPILDPEITEGVELTADEKKFIDSIYNAYSKYDTATLEYMTHAEDPWQKARIRLEINESSNNEITKESMQAYYSSRLKAVITNG